MESKVVYIYGLWDSRDGRLRYIGKTVNPKYRLYRHCVDYDRGKITHCSTWIKGILNDGLKPLMEILEECNEDNWKEIERIWITKGRELGLDLVNMADGGTGGGVRDRIVSEETKKKLSNKLKGRVSPGKGKPLSPEHKAKFLEGRRGKKPRLGMKNSPEQNAKIGAANAKALKGREISQEEKDRLRAVGIMRWAIDGERERHRERALNRPRNSKGQFLSRDEI